MFSGLTNQVTSWMGTTKGEQPDEEVPQPDGVAGMAGLTVTDEQPDPSLANVEQAQEIVDPDASRFEYFLFLFLICSVFSIDFIFYEKKRTTIVTLIA